MDGRKKMKTSELESKKSLADELSALADSMISASDNILAVYGPSSNAPELFRAARQVNDWERAIRAEILSKIESYQ